jgi:hypothetical protein
VYVVPSKFRFVQEANLISFPTAELGRHDPLTIDQWIAAQKYTGSQSRSVGFDVVDDGFSMIYGGVG